MDSFTTVFLFGLVAVVLCESNYDINYQRPTLLKPSGHPRPQRPRPPTYADKPLTKEFDAEEVQNILLNSIPGKDYPIFSLDYLPQTSFKCSDSNIHYPGYYADVETGCQVFHFCPPKLEDNSYQQQPMPTYQPNRKYPQQEEQEPQYRRKRDSYGQQQQQPATYYDTPEMQPAPYQPPSQYRPPVQSEEQVPSYQPKYPEPVPQQPYEPVPQQRYEPIQTNYVQEEQLITFICPNQTIFNQKTLVCEWFYNVVCEHAIQNYDLANSRLYHENAPLLDEIPEVEHPNHLNLSPNLQKMPPQQNSYKPPQGHRQMRPPKQLPHQSQYEDQPY